MSKDLFGNEIQPKKLDPKEERAKMIARHARKSGKTMIIHGYAKDLVENLNSINVEVKEKQKGHTAEEMTMKFISYHNARPEVLEFFIQEAFRDLKRGHELLSINFIFEALRRNPKVDISGVINDFKPYYSRMMACVSPALHKCFLFIKSGPDNNLFYDFLKDKTRCGNPVAIFYGETK